MRRLDLLGLAQRIVLVVALGAGLVAIGQFVMTVSGSRSADVGWFGYAPLSTRLPSEGWPAWAILATWLAVIAVWTVASVRMLRPRPRDEP
jgi:hypothetical protein